MAKIIDLSGNEQEVKCIACAIQKNKVKLPVERIAETRNFVLEQDFEWPIGGFLIIASKRHIHSILDFNKDEEKEFFHILKKSRKLMKDVLGIGKVTIIQEEGSSDSHFHVWLFPWYRWMKPHGSKLQDIKNLMKYAKENFSDKKHLDKIRKIGKELKSKF
ncbi:MAG TPA: HIT family hydrolase [Candidatus Nanoarchaeia archaeon]|nr:HIT family hydrolase [Candidatus Nanoarchaeia archaeon]